MSDGKGRIRTAGDEGPDDAAAVGLSTRLVATLGVGRVTVSAVFFVAGGDAVVRTIGTRAGTTARAANPSAVNATRLCPRVTSAGQGTCGRCRASSPRSLAAGPKSA